MTDAELDALLAEVEHYAAAMTMGEKHRRAWVEECQRADRLEADNAALRKIAAAASHALRSYQYGNASTELAESTADAIDAAMREGKSG